MSRLEVVESSAGSVLREPVVSRVDGALIGELPQNIPQVATTSLQARRDEVRAMVGQGKPAAGIPLYQGRTGGHGTAAEFIQRYYGRYAPDVGVHTLFLHDLRSIDPRLCTALANESRGSRAVLGTKFDLVRALVEGRFEDGPNTATRVYDAKRHVKKRKA